MKTPFFPLLRGSQEPVSRRRFVTGTVATGASLILGTSAFGQTSSAAQPQRKIKLGLIGCGQRGRLVGSLFKENGGFELFAVADYFQTEAETVGDMLGVERSRRFSGLSGYQKVIETGVEAVALENIPGFMPSQATAAANAGCHVYMAKPVAADVPGCLEIEAAAKIAGGRADASSSTTRSPPNPRTWRW